ncbi:unnamed protein product [Paramecium sonneborni]|uniref:Uncharacterized protein n=1 Tax=Paramecium sonneborni TaxID=65129 RepID=A0A8S1K9A7_9CILI|nr:unnamed protein product [Paramecium sonneborni]
MSQQLFKAYFLSLNHNFKDLPKGNFYYRFFKRDLGRIINMPCPIDNPSQSSEIHLFKQLRAQIGISEENPCYNCPFNAKCSQAFQQFDIPQIQTLLLPNLSKFLESITNHNLNIQNLDDSKSFWLASNRILDTFQAIVYDYQKNSNQINQLFLQDQDTPSDTEKTNFPKQNLKTEKYYKTANFLNDIESNDKDKDSNSSTSQHFENVHQNKENNYKKQSYQNSQSKSKQTQRTYTNKNHYQTNQSYNQQQKRDYNKNIDHTSENKSEISFTKDKDKKDKQNKSVQIKNEKQIKKNMKFRVAQ